MIVYGDRTEVVRTAERIEEVRAALTRIAAMAPDWTRHQALVSSFIDLAGLIQGVADERFAASGADADDQVVAGLMEALTCLAACVIQSWDSASQRLGRIPVLDLAADELPAEVTIKLPEGFAHYGLYPEAYAQAARRLPARARVKVIGLRSIGVGLGAMVAAALGADPPISLRPSGHPFAREIKAVAKLAAKLVQEGAAYVVVDEGPGLSGSSFGAAADWLEGCGVARDRIMFLPGHLGELGPRASAPHRERWSNSVRQVVGVDELLEGRLNEWVADVVGPVRGVHEVSGGGWRSLFWNDEAAWPAVCPTWERRKFLVDAADSQWLLRFAGLGRNGEEKLRRAEVLHAAGLGPEPRALLHGWLLERWYGEATPLGGRDLSNADLTAMAGYLAVRATMVGGEGASVTDLLDMAEFNFASALGRQIDAAFDDLRCAAQSLQARVKRVAIDGRMMPHEWLRLPSGRLLKADALDHCVAHDLIGCQDIAWDFAGIFAEFDLGLEKRNCLLKKASQAGVGVDLELLALLEPCYLAFRIGQCSMAADMLSDWPAERARNLAALDYYLGRARPLLQRP